eukprot:Skav215205  [mRNA]  locus=scaffold2517:19898:68844:- [translate_table: standard]
MCQIVRLALALCATLALAECDDAECDATLLMQQKSNADMPTLLSWAWRKSPAALVDTNESNTSIEAKSTMLAEPATCDNMLEAMGRGINIGNTYDMNQDSQDPAVVKERVKWIYEQGFKHIRLPVTWGSSFDPGSKLTAEVTEVVDYALGLGLYVVLNAHHENWLKEHYDGSKWFNDQFWGLWHNIALHFQSRNRRLIFEILNEPEKAFGSWPGSGNWPQPFDEHAMGLTKQINGVGYDAVRRVSNDRMVFISPNAMASIGTANSLYPNAQSLPGGGNDACLGVTVHTYDPWEFAGDTGNNAFYGTVERMKLGLYDTWKNLHIWQFNSGIKLYVGEFGVGRRDCCKAERHTDLVKEYYKFAMNHFRANGWAAAAWDDPGWFAIYHEKEQGIASKLMDSY